MQRRFRRGQVIGLREMWHSVVWAARPVIVVEDAPDRVMTYSPHGNRFMAPFAPGGSSPLRLYVKQWRLVEDRWRGPSVLSFAFPGIPYAVLLFFDPKDGGFAGYYINVQSPLARTDVGFDYVDHILDARISADRSSWSWKDEDELDEAVERGSFTREDAKRFHRWGGRGVEHVLLREPPFDRDWHGWRPDPTWDTSPELPGGWDSAPIRAASHEVLGDDPSQA